MGIWMEVRCEARTQDFADKAKCWSHENTGPMEMANDTQTSVIDTLRELTRDAKRGGWVKMKAGWVCPDCARHMREHDIPASVLDA
jgi:hypothetical protein